MEERTTLYLDVDDDITAIIGKINKAEKAKVAMVVPKRSSVLQSAVNLKLIKKSAKDSEKEPIIISDDPGVMRLAGGLGILTAPNLKTEPAVPKIDEPTSGVVPSDVIEGETIGAAAVAGAVVASRNKEEAFPIKDNSATSASANTKPTATSAKDGKGKKSKIPDFNRFKKKMLIFAGAGILGLFALWSMIFWLPKATILISGTTQSLDTQFNFTVDTDADKPNFETAVLPGKTQELNKTLSSTFTATGKKDLGTKATGTVTIRNCDYGSGFSLSSGSKFTAASGKVFVTTASVSVPGFSGPASNCSLSGNSAGTATVNVQASENGESYNLASQAYSFAYTSSDVDAVGSAMSGGTTKNATVVTAQDVEAAKNQILEKERQASKDELDNKFGEDDFVIKESFTETVKEVTSSPAVDQEATQGQLTVKVTYFEYGVNQADLEELIARKAKTQENKQLGVVNSGLDKATFKTLGKPADSAQEFQIKTEVLLGPDIPEAQLKEQIGGKNYSDTIEIVKAYPNVTNVEVKFSPFYVRKVPSNPEKIEIKIEVPGN